MLAEAFDRMPHAGAMRLLGQIDHADAHTIRATAKDHAGADYPLRVDGVLFTAALTELGAQTAAAHVSLFATERQHTGLVLALRKVTLAAPLVTSPGRLIVSATQETSLESAAEYVFEVMQDGDRLISGRVLLSIQAE